MYSIPQMPLLSAEDMTHETLRSVLARANGGDGPEVLLPFPLTATVVWATLWLEAPSPDTTARRMEGDKVYLIHNGQQYVAIVLDLGSLDLHWFVLPEHRGQQYLSTALRDVILPHLLQDGRTSQRITISRNFGQRPFEASEKLALAVGFEHLPPGEDDTPSVASLQYIPALPEELVGLSIDVMNMVDKLSKIYLEVGE